MAARDQSEDLLAFLVAIINQSVIDNVRHFATHASVVGHGHRIVAFPAESGGGKTTLAAAAVLHGFDYLSDEALVLEANAGVVPYPKPMALSTWSCETLGLEPRGEETLFTVSDLGGKVHVESRELTDLVIAGYGAAAVSLEEVSRSRAVAELLGKSFNHYKDPERAFRVATEAARQAKVWVLEYDNPLTAVEALAERLTS